MKKIFSALLLVMLAPATEASDGYAEAYKAAQEGKVVYLAIGVDPQPGDLACPARTDYESGRYIVGKGADGLPHIDRILPPVYRPVFPTLYSVGGS